MRSTSVELVVGVAARQFLMLARLPFLHDRIGLVALTGVAPAQATGPPPSESGVSAVPPQRDWSLRDGSNVQPSACRAGALPLSYAGRWYRDKDLNLARLLQRQLSYR